MAEFKIVEVDGGIIQIVDDNDNVIGIATAPIRIDPTGSTTQPISASSLPLPMGAATESTLSSADGKLTTIDSVLDGIKDTDGVKKITDPLPAGSNEIGRIRGYLYDDVNNVALAVAHDITVPTNTRGLIVAGQCKDGKSYFLGVNAEGKLCVQTSPPTPPAGTTEFVLAGDDPLTVGPSPNFYETVSSVIANGVTLKLQFIAAGAEGDPSERGSKLEIYWREGTGPTDHLIERLYITGATVFEELPDVSKTRDDTSMVGNGTNTYLVIRRERLSNSGQEIDSVVRGYLES